jgi:hypothetical protein
MPKHQSYYMSDPSLRRQHQKAKERTKTISWCARIFISKAMPPHLLSRMVPFFFLFSVWSAMQITTTTATAPEQPISTKLKSSVHRNAQEDEGENIFQVGSGSLSTPSLAPTAQTFNYRACGTGGQQGFARLEFVYDVETNLKILPAEEVIESLSRAMMDRLLNTSCGLTFYQPPLRVASLSSGLQDEFLRPCSIRRSVSRSCSRYIGSLLVGLNNTDVLGSIDRRVGNLILPLVASDMESGVYLEMVNQELESLQMTRVAYVGVPIYGEKNTTAEKSVENGELTPLGYGLLGFSLVLFVCVCFGGCYIYRNIIRSNNEKGEVNSTFLIEEEEEEEAEDYDDYDDYEETVAESYQVPALQYRVPALQIAPLRRVDSNTGNSVSHRMMKPKVYHPDSSKMQATSHKRHVRPSPFDDTGNPWRSTPLSTLEEENSHFRRGSKRVRREIAL